MVEWKIRYYPIRNNRMIECENFACIFCEENKATRAIQDGKYYYDCPRCGKYEYISSEHSNIHSFLYNKNEELKKIVNEFCIYANEEDVFKTYCSFVLHEKHQGKDFSVTITSDFVKKLTEEYRAFDIMEQIDNFIYWLCSTSDHTGTDLRVLYDNDAFRFYNHIFPHFGCTSVDNFCNLLEMLEDDGYLCKKQREQGYFYSPTIKAYKLYEELKKGKKATNKAFLALRFEGDLSKNFKKELKEAVSQTGFILSTVDEKPLAGLIDDKIKLDIRNSRFVIADLTDENNGAYWEAGFAEGMGKPVIYMCRDDIMNNAEKKPHFDVSHHQCIIWLADKFEEAMKKLKNTIRYTFPDAVQEDKNDKTENA